MKTSSIVYNKNKIDFKNPVFCYFAGWVATDGYLDKNSDRISIRLLKKDSDVLYKFNTYFESNDRVRFYTKKDKNMETCDFTLPGKELIEELTSKFQIPRFNKTFDLGYPKNFHSEECKQMYLRGVFEGDGNLDCKNGRIRIYTGSISFIENLKSEVESIILKSINTLYIKNKYPGFEVSSKKGFLDLISYLYEKNLDFVLNRKYDVYKNWLKI